LLNQFLEVGGNDKGIGEKAAETCKKTEKVGKAEKVEKDEKEEKDEKVTKATKVNNAEKTDTMQTEGEKKGEGESAVRHMDCDNEGASEEGGKALGSATPLILLGTKIADILTFFFLLV
jgi:hypothetical protein